MEGTVPPQAVELEEAVLGALMLERDSIIAVQEYITSDTFYTEEHRLIYKAIESLSAELKPIDLYTVTERLKVRKELKKVGGAAYLAQLTQKVGSAANVEFHAKIIAQKYVQRELIRSATEIQRRSYDEDQDVTDLIGFAEGEIFKVAEGHVKRSVQNAKDILAKALAQIEEASKNSSAFKRSGCNSGKPTESAYCLTAENCNWCPRPAGLSGIVTTATTLYPPSINARRLSTAKSGVPM